MTKEDFLKGVTNFDNHRNLLWQALISTEMSESGDNGNLSKVVIELGAGHGSTPFLNRYCNYHARDFYSYENSAEWIGKLDLYKVNFVTDWNKVSLRYCSVLLIDHAPGERRKEDIKRWANYAKIIVCHDTEPAADHGYQMRNELKKFKYMIDYKSEGAWASAVSNTIDVSKWQIN